MRQRYIVAILLMVAFLVVSLTYPIVLRLARRWGIYDNPNIRKNQKDPVPVFGGVASFIGILVGITIGEFFFDPTLLSLTLASMTIMLVIGVWDDVKDISPVLRFLIEMAVVYLFMMMGGRYIDDFRGLWGIDQITLFKAIPLSLLAGVGIINATNLIDGINGYCSGFCIMACALFGAFFICTGNLPMGCIAFICIGAILPFFLHNVFGKKSLMFLGDGGSLMMGMLMTAFVFNAITSVIDIDWFLEDGFGVVPFTLAVMAIPVFDTLRVMMSRILNNRSPFSPDRTHLHHVFLDLGFSHVGTTLSILAMNFFIVVLWFLAWKLGLSVDVQLYVVLAFGVLCVWGFYYFAKSHINRNTRTLRFLQSIAKYSHFENKPFWIALQRIVDRSVL